LSRLYVKTNILPRQARDKHREDSPKGPFSRRTLAAAGSSAGDESNSSVAMAAAGSPGHAYTMESVVQSGTLVLRWFVDNFGSSSSSGPQAKVQDGDGDGEAALGDSDASVADDFAEWEAKARALPPGAEGLVTVPHFWGCRFPDARPALRGATLGWSHNHGKEHLYRSVMEGLCLELRRAADCMDSSGDDGDGGGCDRTVYVGGGGAGSDLLLEILADCLDRRVVAVGEGGGEAVARGAALLAARGAGVAHDFRGGGEREEAAAGRSFVPDPARAALYDELFARVYCPLLEAATPLSAELGAISTKAAALATRR
jgi:sugar (pentulose or hexulose) kinase